MMEMDIERSPSEHPLPFWSGRDVLLITGGILLVFAVAILGLQVWIAQSGIQQEDIPLNIYLTSGLGALEAVALIGAIYVLGLRRKNLGWEAVGVRPVNPIWLAISFAVGLAVIPFSMVITLITAWIVQIITGVAPENTQLGFLAPEGFSWIGLFSMILFGGILAPIAEEFFFRGVLFGWMRTRWSFGLSVILSSLVFALIHADILVGVAALAISPLLAWIYERSNTIWTAVIVHAMNNSLKIILLYIILLIMPELAG
jgi:membrane protease YdiL (CAAX protease family)